MAAPDDFRDKPHNQPLLSPDQSKAMNDELRAQVQRAEMAQRMAEMRAQQSHDGGRHMSPNDPSIPYLFPLMLPIGVFAGLVYFDFGFVKAGIVALLTAVVVAPIAFKRLFR